MCIYIYIHTHIVYYIYIYICKGPSSGLSSEIARVERCQKSVLQHADTCMYMYVYIYIYREREIYMCIYIYHTYTFIYIYIYIHTHPHTHTHTYIYIYIYIHTHTHKHVYIYIYIYVKKSTKEKKTYKVLLKTNKNGIQNDTWEDKNITCNKCVKEHARYVYRRKRWSTPTTTCATVDFRNFIVFFGPRPWHIEIRHRVKKHPQLICSDLRLSNWVFEDWNYGNRPYSLVSKGGKWRSHTKRK